AAGQRHYALFGLVGGQERIAFLLVGLALLCLFGLHLGLHLTLQLHQRGTGFFFRQQRLVAAQSVFHALEERSGVHINVLAVQSAAQVHANRVTGFLFRGSQRGYGPWLGCRRAGFFRG